MLSLKQQLNHLSGLKLDTNRVKNYTHSEYSTLNMLKSGIFRIKFQPTHFIPAHFIPLMGHVPFTFSPETQGIFWQLVTVPFWHCWTSA